jgi:hypothetical protein
MTAASKMELIMALRLVASDQDFQLSRIRPDKWLHADSPDLGWRAAGFIAQFWKEGPPHWCGLLRVEGLEIIREAFLLRYCRDIKGWDPDDHQIAFMAEGIFLDPPSAELLKALLFAVDASIDGVANLMGMMPELVQAFSNLFFDVEGRSDDVLFRQRIFASETASQKACLLPPTDDAKFGSHLISTALRGTMGEVMHQYILRHGGGSEEEQISNLRRQCLAEASSLKSSGTAKCPEHAKTGLAIARNWSGSAAEVETGTLDDPFLSALMSDNNAYNAYLRQKSQGCENGRESSVESTDASESN